MQKYFTPKFVIPAVILGLVGLALLWWLASPLFINQAVNEAAPQAAAQAQGAAIVEKAKMAQAQEPVALKTQMAELQPHTANDAMPAQGPSTVREGQFYNVVHDGSGTAQIIKLEDGSYVLRFDDFQVLNGPDLYVYLTSADQVAPEIGGELPDTLSLGKLKGNIGAQNYVLPADIDLSKYKSVVIWCQAFHVPFSAAPLS